MRRIVAVLAAGVALAACGVNTESSPRRIAPDRLPVALQDDDAASTTTTIATALVPVEVWFVRDGRLVGVEHEVQAPLTAAGAVTELATGPSGAESDSLRSAIPDALLIVDTTVAGDTAIVDLAEDFNQIPTTDQRLAIGQLVLTLTALDGVDQVRFRLNGVDTPVPLPDGTSTDAPVTAEDFADLRS